MSHDFYLGMVTDDAGRQRQVVYHGDRHLLTVGGSGLGKSVGLIVPNLAQFSGSAVVIDPRGECAAICAERLRKRGTQVFCVNPFNILAEHYTDLASCGFNPLAMLDPQSETFAKDAAAIASAFVVEREGAHDAHWIESARDLVTALIMLECSDNPKRVGELGNVRNMLGLPHKAADENRVSLTKMLVMMETSNIKALRNKGERYKESGNELYGVLAEARTQTQSLDSVRVTADLSKKSPLRFEQLKERPTVVFLVLPAHELDKHSRWLRLMIVSALRALLKSPPSETVGSVLILCDEFSALGTMREVATSIQFARGYGVKYLSLIHI